MTADAYAPPIGWWGHTWRTVLVLLVSGVALVSPAEGSWNDVPWLFWVDLSLGLASFVLSFYRRRWPFAVAVLLNLAGFVSASSAGPALLASVSLATRRRLWQVVVVGLVSVGAGQVFWLTQERQQQSWWLQLVFVVAITVAMLASGAYIGSRRELMWNLQERARSAEEQQELRLTSARAAERERIAREMHDVLAHRISMVSMHAGALAYRTDLPAAQVQETAALIQSTAHQALTELRQVLGVLRDDAGALRDRPQPTIADLPELVREARSAGMRVDLAQSVAADDQVPDAVGRTVYRIVQEGLTNARKHALGAAVRVEIAGTPGPGVDVWVRNDVRTADRTTTPGAGLGLVGLRERTELAGGRLEVESVGSAFALHGWLPWPT